MAAKTSIETGDVKGALVLLARAMGEANKMTGNERQRMVGRIMSALSWLRRA